MNNLSNEQRELCKNCFNYFVDSKNVYKPTYNISKYQISRRQFLLYAEIYYNLYATEIEKNMYDNIIKNKKNNKFEQLKNKYREAFIMYIKNEDTEEYYNDVALSSRISIQTAKRYPMHYYDKYASDEERKIFDQIKKNKQEKNILNRQNQTKEKYKEMFDTCVESNFDEEQIDNLTEKYSVSLKTVKNYTNNYYDKYATKEEQEKYQIAKEKHKENNARYVKIFNHILSMDKIEDILLYLINQKNLNRTYLKTSINPYSISYPNADINKLNKIIDIYYNYVEYRNKKEKLKKQQKEEKIKKEQQEKKIISNKILEQKRKIINLVKMVKSFNQSDYLSYIEYCKDNNISLKNFNCALKVTFKIDKKTYLEFINKLRKYNQKKYIKEFTILSEIIINLKNNDKFGIIDYYNMTKINLNELNMIAKKVLKKEDYLIFSEFYEKYKNDELINPNILIKASYMINSYGNQVELTKEQKSNIIDYLSKNEIPITKYTYLEMIKRTIEEKPKQKKKVA